MRLFKQLSFAFAAREVKSAGAFPRGCGSARRGVPAGTSAAGVGAGCWAAAAAVFFFLGAFLGVVLVAVSVAVLGAVSVAFSPPPPAAAASAFLFFRGFFTMLKCLVQKADKFRVVASLTRSTRSLYSSLSLKTL